MELTIGSRFAIVANNGDQLGLGTFVAMAAHADMGPSIPEFLLDCGFSILETECLWYEPEKMYPMPPLTIGIRASIRLFAREGDRLVPSGTLWPRRTPVVIERIDALMLDDGLVAAIPFSDRNKDEYLLVQDIDFPVYREPR